MNQLRVFVLMAILSLAVGAFAQGGMAAKSASPAKQAQTASEPSTIASVVDSEVSAYEKNVVGVAEAMPEDKYNFTPNSLNIKGAAYGNVRTFAELVKHTATANYRFWGMLTGEKMPANIKGPNGPEELKSKAEIVKFLKDSFEVGHRAAKSLTAQNALEELPFFRGTQPRLFIATFTVIHAADEYGQMVEYLRMNGIVPPASRGRM